MKIKSNPIVLILSLMGLLFMATVTIFISRPTQAARNEIRVAWAVGNNGVHVSASVTTTESIYLPTIIDKIDDPFPTPSPTETPLPTETSTHTPVPTAIPTATSTPFTPSDLNPGTNQIMIDQMIEGVSVARPVYIQAPQSLGNARNAEPYPIVFAFHGAGGSGQGFTNSSHLNQLIDAGNFIGVYPNGHSTAGGNGGFWNLGTEPTTADDVEFVNLIVQKLATYSELDTSKMYGLGISNGSGMINLLGKSTTHFKAIAPLYSQQSTTTGALTPATTLSVFQLNGDADTLIPISGGGSVVGEFLSAENSALNWANHFSCTKTPVEEDLTWTSASLKAFTYSDCESGHEVRYYVASHVGHSGFQNQAATGQMFAEIWAFFQQHE